MNLDLTGKRAYVGGGSKGIGLACAQELAQLGCSLTLASRSEDDLIAAIKTLDNSKAQTHEFLVVDYSNLIDLEKQVKKHLDSHGNFHILINNTGGPPGGPIADAKGEEFTNAFNNHLLANHLLAQLCVPGMREDAYGRIINIISTSVKIPLNGLGVSNTIRGAVASWAKTMANELGVDGITVNNVLPGATGTDRLNSIIQHKAAKQMTDESAIADQMRSIIPMKRFGEPHEVGAFVAFLASPAAGYITGTSTPVDGGRTGSI